MKLIVGLGNPGKGYEYTRHNCGFEVINQLSKELNIPLNQTKFKGIFGKAKVNGEDVILLQPQTYMNNSGESVQAIMSYFKIDLEDIIVIYDDLDLPTGKLRLRTKGSAGGHNGIKSLIKHLGTPNFNRIRVGIDKNSNYQIIDYVLGHFSPLEMPLIEEGFKKASMACQEFIESDNFANVMNKYNRG